MHWTAIQSRKWHIVRYARRFSNLLFWHDIFCWHLWLAADKLLKLTEVMARHSFSVTDMRNYFRLLRDTFEKKNMPHLEKLLRSFQSMCYKRGPAAVFDFDGEKSCVSDTSYQWIGVSTTCLNYKLQGLSIPAFKMPAGGYSFCTWLRAEDFQDQLAPGVEPKIYRCVKNSSLWTWY